MLFKFMAFPFQQLNVTVLLAYPSNLTPDLWKYEFAAGKRVELFYCMLRTYRKFLTLHQNFPPEILHNHLAFASAMMHHTKQTSQSEGQRAIPSFCARICYEWSTFISPHTPPYGFRCSPRDKNLDYVHILLLGMTMVLETAAHKDVPAMASQIVPMWPCIWTWLRTFNDHGQPSRSLHHGEDDRTSVRSREHALIVDLIFVIVFLTPTTAVCKLVKETEGVTNMMATAWVDEGEDT